MQSLRFTPFSTVIDNAEAKWTDKAVNRSGGSGVFANPRFLATAPLPWSLCTWTEQEMTHIQVCKMIEDRSNYANRQWWYGFQQLPKLCPEENAEKRSQKLLQQFALKTKNWNSDLNSEWTVRVFYAAKMVLAASVMAQSLKLNM